MPTCVYCGDHKNSRANLKQHIQQLPTCRAAFREYIQGFNIHAADVDGDEEAFNDPESENRADKSVDSFPIEYGFTNHNGGQPAFDLHNKEQRQQPYVEDVPDKDDRTRAWNHRADGRCFVGPYPHPAGIPIDVSQGSTKFEDIFKTEGDSGLWGKFKTEGKWKLAKWLLDNVGHNQIAQFLDLSIVRTVACTMF
jgi:hypothetical protein